MKDFIGNIFYFGSPKDGFKVYPNLGAVSNTFSGYYTNAEKADWILIAKKSGNATTYTYVKYGLLTTTSDVRGGSCLGISIELFNCYFTNLELFRTQIIEMIWGAFLHEGKLLEIQKSSGRVAFKSFDFFDISPYLDEMSVKVKTLIGDDKFSDLIRQSYEIPDSENKPLYALNPESSPKAINEYFKNYGIVKLSPDSPIEYKSISEKNEEHKQNLQEEVNKLTKQLEQKNGEIKSLLLQKSEEVNEFERKINRIQKGLEVLISNEFPVIIREDNLILQNASSTVNQPNLRHTWKAYPESQKASSTYYKEEQLTHRWNQNISRRTIVIVSVIVTFLLLSVFIFYYATNSFNSNNIEEKANTNNINVPPQLNQSKIVTRKIEPLRLKEKDGKTQKYLDTSVFLDNNKGKNISSLEDFKEAMTLFLFSHSSEINERYEGDKDRLWNDIMNQNDANKNKIISFFRQKSSFEIENNQNQQEILKDLLIIQK